MSEDNPYRDPGTPLSPGDPKASSTSSFWRYRSLETLCLIATIGLTAHAGLLICGSLMGMFGEIAFPGFSDPSMPIGSDLELAVFYTQNGLLILGMLVYFFNAVIVCMFMYRANANARALGAINLENNPGWCIGYWFIPILNWFKPYQCMNEIHKASSRPDGRAWKMATPHPLMGAWWACWLIGNTAANFQNRMAMSEIHLGVGGIVLDCAATLLLAAAAFSLIIILRSITELQSSSQFQPREKIGPVE